MPGTPNVNEFFTATNIASVGFATTAVTVVSATLYKLASLPQKWTAFIVALLIAYVVVLISATPQWYDWVFAFFNACLLYCSALGATELGVAATTPPGKGAITSQGFFVSWFEK